MYFINNIRIFFINSLDVFFKKLYFLVRSFQIWFAIYKPELTKNVEYYEIPIRWGC
jgi:hypothetical protein